MGDSAGRVLTAVQTGGLSEVARRIRPTRKLVEGTEEAITAGLAAGIDLPLNIATLGFAGRRGSEALGLTGQEEQQAQTSVGISEDEEVSRLRQRIAEESAGRRAFLEGVFGRAPVGRSALIGT